MGGGVKNKTTRNLRTSEEMTGIIIEKLRMSERVKRN
jgi:hypothetical protein